MNLASLEKPDGGTRALLEVRTKAATLECGELGSLGDDKTDGGDSWLTINMMDVGDKGMKWEK